MVYGNFASNLRRMVSTEEYYRHQGTTENLMENIFYLDIETNLSCNDESNGKTLASRIGTKDIEGESVLDERAINKVFKAQ